MSKKRKRNPALETFLDWVESIVFAVFGVIFLFTFVLESVWGYNPVIYDGKIVEAPIEELDEDFYGDEELTRWAGALLRHYCVDGQREMLSSKYGFSCNPELLSNCDFDEGLECWTPAPAQPGAISPWYRKNFGRQFQRRSNEGENFGDHAALFVRSDKGPNRLTQKAIGLIPGHKYALRFYTADPDEIELDKGVSVNFAFRADVSDARILPELGYERRYMARHEMVTHKVVFIPEGTEADITFSDWKGDDEVGAPVGQRRVLNFVSLTPFFE